MKSYRLEYGTLRKADSYVRDLVLLGFPFEVNFPDDPHEEALEALLDVRSYVFFDGNEPVGILYFNEFEGFDGCFIHFAKVVDCGLDFRRLISPVGRILEELLDKSGKFKYNAIYGWTPYGSELARIAAFFGFSLEDVDASGRYLYKKEG